MLGDLLPLLSPPATSLSSLLTSKRPTLPPVSLVLLKFPYPGPQEASLWLIDWETFVLTRQLIWTEMYISHSMRLI